MRLDFSRAVRLYREAGIDGTVGLGDRPAMLVVDFTYGFTDPESPIGCDMTAAVEATGRVLAVARRSHLPIFYSVNAFRADLADAGVWAEKYPALRHLALGTRWTEIDARVAPHDNDVVIVKQYPSAFFGTALASMLTAARVDSLVLTGTTTSGCIRASAVDGLQYGYRVTIPDECVADRDEAPHRANLFDLATKYADVIGVDEVVERLGKISEPASVPDS